MIKTDEQVFQEALTALLTTSTKLENLAARYPEFGSLCDQLVQVSDVVKLRFHRWLRSQGADYPPPSREEG